MAKVKRKRPQKEAEKEIAKTPVELPPPTRNSDEHVTTKVID